MSKETHTCSNYAVILINRLQMYGAIGEKLIHVFSDENEFGTWYDEEKHEHYAIHKKDASIKETMELAGVS